MRLGRRIAFDVGKARTGVAISDSSAILASPAQALRSLDTVDESAKQALHLVLEHNAIEIYVGLPINLKGVPTESTLASLNFARALQALTDVEVRLIDERFTTRLASDSLRAAGKNTRDQRSLIDSASATVILNAALEHERANGSQPGLTIEELEIEK
jgi:putative Holliday junction resolvase